MDRHWYNPVEDQREKPVDKPDARLQLPHGVIVQKNPTIFRVRLRFEMAEF
ncbi:hypothetical protein SAMN05443999_103139 [Roseovarius azorensis]|uniref:Uncharacterized protein n=1 Tax=Roseovarius azorensis TaxID=1287727 RepID=A0A1H7LUW5_9RHOB|nr:hypothetical protein SAMN05443999_103139 [Roseovarius azorensis]